MAPVQSDALKTWQDFYDRYAEDPEGFIRGPLGVGPDTFGPNPDNPSEIIQLSGIDPWQVQVIEWYKARERRISGVSGHGVGKSTCESWLAIHQACFRYPQKTVCTAPSSTQLFDALAAEMKSWIKRLPPALEDLFEVKAERIELKSDPTGSFISFRTSRADQPEALAGVHSEWVLLIADEASGIPDKVFQAAGGSMSGHNAITILMGNGVRSSGLFFDTHNKDDVKRKWKTIRVNAETSPRVSKDFIEDMRSRYGVESNAYRVRVLGLFPLAEDDTIIGYEIATMALDRDVDPKLNQQTIWGVDVARFGTDKSALCKRRGNILTEKVIEWAGYDLMQTAGRIKREWDETRPTDRPVAINIDAIGMGAGVADRLRELKLPAFAINVSEVAALTDKYRNLKTELWFNAKDWFLKRDCNIAGDEKLRDQLVNLRYEYTSDGKYWAETKKKLKARGVASPNLAEAFTMTFAYEAATLSGQTASVGWDTPVRRDIKGIV